MRILQAGLIGGIVVVALVFSVTLFRVRPHNVILGKELRTVS